MKTMGAALCLSVFLFSGGAFASGTGINQDVKWSQLPEMEEAWGKDIVSNYDPSDGRPNRVVMDDWLCPDGRPITDIHWWGSYFNGGGDNCFCECPDPPENPVRAFHISIHEDIPARCWIPSHPGNLLANYVIPFDRAGETYFGTDAQGHDVYKYNIWLPEEFEQEQGRIYWLGIVAILADDTCLFGQVWGWHTAVQPHNLDDSVSIFNYNYETGGYWLWLPNKFLVTDDVQEWNDGIDTANFFGGECDCKPPCWDFISLDMAFELTTVPEPMTACMAVLSLAGLVGLARRR